MSRSCRHPRQHSNLRKESAKPEQAVITDRPRDNQGGDQTGHQTLHPLLKNNVPLKPLMNKRKLLLIGPIRIQKTPTLFSSNKNHPDQKVTSVYLYLLLPEPTQRPARDYHFLQPSQARLAELAYFFHRLHLAPASSSLGLFHP